MITILIIGIVLNILSSIYFMWSLWDGGENITVEVLLIGGVICFLPFVVFISAVLECLNFEAILIKGKKK